MAFAVLPRNGSEGDFRVTSLMSSLVTSRVACRGRGGKGRERPRRGPREPFPFPLPNAGGRGRRARNRTNESRGEKGSQADVGAFPFPSPFSPRLQLRGGRAKAMKFKDGYMISSGSPVHDYIVTSMRHLLMRQGTLGLKVKIMLDWDPSGKLGPTYPLPDIVTVHKPKDEEADGYKPYVGKEME